MSIVSFPGVALSTPADDCVPNQKIIDLLEKTLAAARAGQVVAIGICTVRSNGKTRDVYELDGPWGHHLVAATAYLHQGVVAASVDAGETIEEINDPA